MITEPYPLVWPDNMPRTTKPQSGKFSTSLAKAVENVETSLRLFAQDSGQKVSDTVTTSNKAGLTNSQPADKGVAIWFMWDGETRCIAVDRYSKIEHNVQAIHHIIEARRTELRHGGLNVVRQTFKGFTALPAPPGSDWRTVLGLREGSSSPEIVKARFVELAKTAHPDKGGDPDEFKKLTDARDAALKELKGK